MKKKLLLFVHLTCVLIIEATEKSVAEFVVKIFQINDAWNEIQNLETKKLPTHECNSKKIELIANCDQLIEDLQPPGITIVGRQDMIKGIEVIRESANHKSYD